MKPPDKPPRPGPDRLSSDEARLMRSRAPSFPELFTELSSSHTIDSEAPAVRWLDRRTGRAVRLTIVWVLRSRWAWAIWTTIGGAAITVLNKCTHVFGP